MEKYGYNDENGHKILQAIDAKKILSFFHDTFEDSIQYYYQGKVLLEVIDHRFDLSPSPSFRFFLHVFLYFFLIIFLHINLDILIYLI